MSQSSAFRTNVVLTVIYTIVVFAIFALVEPWTATIGSVSYLTFLLVVQRPQVPDDQKIRYAWIYSGLSIVTALLFGALGAYSISLGFVLYLWFRTRGFKPYQPTLRY